MDKAKKIVALTKKYAKKKRFKDSTAVDDLNSYFYAIADTRTTDAEKKIARKGIIATTGSAKLADEYIAKRKALKEFPVGYFEKGGEVVQSEINKQLSKIQNGKDELEWAIFRISNGQKCFVTKLNPKADFEVCDYSVKYSDKKVLKFTYTGALALIKINIGMTGKLGVVNKKGEQQLFDWRIRHVAIMAQGGDVKIPESAHEIKSKLTELGFANDDYFKEGKDHWGNGRPNAYGFWITALEKRYGKTRDEIDLSDLLDKELEKHGIYASNIHVGSYVHGWIHRLLWLNKHDHYALGGEMGGNDFVINWYNGTRNWLVKANTRSAKSFILSERGRNWKGQTDSLVENTYNMLRMYDKAISQGYSCKIIDATDNKELNRAQIELDYKNGGYERRSESKMALGGSIKTFADLKRKLSIGQAVKMIYSNLTSNKLLNTVRYVVRTQTNGVYFSPDKNAKTGSFMDFPNASLTEVSDTGWKIFNSGKRPLNTQELAVRANEPNDPQQSMIDIQTDGSVMYWRKKNYYSKAGYNYLFSGEERGLSLDYNSNPPMINDKSFKGTLMLEYEFVDNPLQVQPADNNLYVWLAAEPNPDYDTDTMEGNIVIAPYKVAVKDMADAQRMVLDFISINNLGSGNYTGGQVYDAKGAKLADIAYNGRIWLESEKQTPAPSPAPATKKAEGVFKRTFEALKFPVGSPERKKLNEESLTSEYMSSYKYLAQVFHPETVTHTAYYDSRSFVGKKDAEYWFDTMKKQIVGATKPDDNAGNMYMLGDKYNSDFDYNGMLMAGMSATIDMGAEKLEKLYTSFSDVNYSTQARIIWDAIKLLKAGDDKAKEKLLEFNRSCEIEMTGEEKSEKNDEPSVADKVTASFNGLAPTADELLATIDVLKEMLADDPKNEDIAVSLEVVEEMYADIKKQPPQGTYFVISYLDKDNGFKKTDKYFNGEKAYEEAVKWGKENLPNFNLDMITLVVNKMATGGSFEQKEYSWLVKAIVTKNGSSKNDSREVLAPNVQLAQQKYSAFMINKLHYTNVQFTGKIKKLGTATITYPVDEVYEMEMREPVEMLANGGEVNDDTVGYVVINETDGIQASPIVYDTLEEAQQFVKEFVERFNHQGYYLTSRGERISPDSVVFDIVHYDGKPLPFANGGLIDSYVGEDVEIELNNGRIIKGKLEKSNPIKVRTDATSTQVIPSAAIKSIWTGSMNLFELYKSSPLLKKATDEIMLAIINGKLQVFEDNLIDTDNVLEKYRSAGAYDTSSLEAIAKFIKLGKFENGGEVGSPGEPYGTYTTEYGQTVKGFISTWNKGVGGEWEGLPVVYAVEANNMGGISSFMVIGGLLKGSELINAGEAIDDWFGNEAQALSAAKELAQNENAFVEEEFADGGNVSDEIDALLNDYGFLSFLTGTSLSWVTKGWRVSVPTLKQKPDSYIKRVQGNLRKALKYEKENNLGSYEKIKIEGKAYADAHRDDKIHLRFEGGGAVQQAKDFTKSQIKAIYNAAGFQIEKIRRTRKDDGWFVYYKQANPYFHASGVVSDWIPDDGTSADFSAMLKMYIIEARNRHKMPTLTKQQIDDMFIAAGINPSEKLENGGGFSMNVKNCQRCGEPTNGITTMSMFNTEVICMKCKEEEKLRPDYETAVNADVAEIKKGNYNYEGIGLKNKFVIKNAFGGYFSRDMATGKPKFLASMEMGFTYTHEEAENMKALLTKDGYVGLEVVPFVPYKGE